MCPDLATAGNAPLGATDARVARFSREWWLDRTMPIPETGCHVWLGSVCKLGYGRVRLPDIKSPVLIHRIAYEQFVGPVPAGLSVCHRCDCPSCVNPDHLFLGTHGDNMRDMFAKRRARPQGRAWGNRKEQIIALIAQSPQISLSEIASELNLTYNYVGQICRNEGISVTRRTCTGRPWVTDSQGGAA